MLTLNDFITRYQQYSDEELMEVYNQINNYSPEAKEAFDYVINKKGGLQRLLYSAEKQKERDLEIQRIAKETIQLTESGVDGDFIRKTTNSALLSTDEINTIIETKQLQSAVEIENKKITARTVAGSIIGGGLSSLIFGTLFGVIMIYSNYIFYIFVIGLALCCYYSIRLATKQSLKNMLVLFATALSLLLAFLIAQFVYSNPSLLGITTK